MTDTRRSLHVRAPLLVSSSWLADTGKLVTWANLTGLDRTWSFKTILEVYGRLMAAMVGNYTIL